MMHRLYILLIAALYCTAAPAQDFHFAQALQHTYLINPASAGQGTEHASRLTLLARTQWDNPGSTKGYQGTAATFEWRHCLSSSRHFFALGLAVQYDWSTLGGLSNTMALPGAAYHLHLGDDWFLAGGGSVGILSYALHGNDLKFDAQYQDGYYDGDRSNLENLSGSGRVVADIASGFECYNNRKGFSLGFSWLHLNQPKYTFIDEDNRLGIGFTTHGSFTHRFNVKGTRALAGKFMLRRQSFNGSNSRQWTLLIGSSGRLPVVKAGNSVLQLGIYTRWGGLAARRTGINAIVPTLTWQNAEWAFTVSYDANTSGIRTRFAGGMEMSMAYSFGKYDRCVNCARF